MRQIRTAPSTNVAGVAYDDEARELLVTFVSGDTYIYTGVPPQVADGFATAPSAGQYLNRMVRNRYPYRQE